MRISVIISLLIFTSSCWSQNESIVGEYVSPSNNWMNRVLLRNTLFDTSIILNEDSTYSYINCTQRITGKWRIINDSLNLFCNTIYFKTEVETDSTGKTLISNCNVPLDEKFRISDGKLESRLEIGGQDLKLVLKKVH